MNYRIIYLLERFLGKVLNWFLSLLVADKKKPFSKEGNPVQKILFVKFIEQGAVVLHLHTFLTAQKIAGAENVFFCTFESNRSFIESLNIFKESQVFYINSDSFLKFFFSYIWQAFQLRRRDIDASVDLEFLSSASIIFSVLSGVKYRSGFVDDKVDSNRNQLVNVPVVYSEKVHVSESGTILLRQFFDFNEIRFLDCLQEIQLRINQKLPGLSSESIKKVFAEKNNALKIIVHPNFVDSLPLRSWPLQNYARLIRQLKEMEPESIIILTGRADEFEPCQRFIEENALTDVVNWCGQTTWTDLMHMYQRADILICTDSGPAHFSSMFELNTVVIFGPETPELYGPLGENVRILYKELACSPCFNAYNQRMSSCKSNICVKEITVDEVIFNSYALLKKKVV